MNDELVWQWAAEEICYDTVDGALAADNMWFRMRMFAWRKDGQLRYNAATDEYQLHVLRDGAHTVHTDLTAIAAVLATTGVVLDVSRTRADGHPIDSDLFPVGSWFVNRLRGPGGCTDVCAVCCGPHVGDMFAVGCAGTDGLLRRIRWLNERTVTVTEQVMCEQLVARHADIIRLDELPSDDSNDSDWSGE